MVCELVQVETEDGVVLHGAFYEKGDRDWATMIVHGAAMNFYTGLGRILPPYLTSAGITCLSINNRGHDFGTAADGDNKPVIGLMRDRFRDCVYDFSAWIRFLRERGYSNLIVIGHSQGVSKIVYAVSSQLYPEVKGLVLVSPPPSIREMIRFLATDNRYERGMFKAKELASHGIREQLIVMKGRGAMPWVFTVDTFLDFYGPGGLPDTHEMTAKIPLPMLLIRGTQDFAPVSSELLRKIKESSPHPDLCTIVEIAEADHFYCGHEQDLAQTIIGWLTDTRGRFSCV